MKAFTKKQNAKAIKQKIRRTLIKAERTMFRIMVSMAVSFAVSSLLFLAYSGEFNIVAKTLYLAILFVIAVLSYIEIMVLSECLEIHSRRAKSRVKAPPEKF